MYAYLTKEHFKKISRMAVIVTATASLLLVSTVPVLGQRPPDCLEAATVTKDGKKHVEVKNKCGRGMRFRIIYDLGSDSECKTIGRAYTKYYKVPSFGKARFNELKEC